MSHVFFNSFRELEDSDVIPYPKELNALFPESREDSSALSKLFPITIRSNRGTLWSFLGQSFMP